MAATSNEGTSPEGQERDEPLLPIENEGDIKEELDKVKQRFEKEVNEIREKYLMEGKGLTLLRLSQGNEIRIGFAIDYSAVKSIS